MTKKLVKKQTGGGTKKATADSTKYYKDENKFQWDLAQTNAKFGLRKSADEHANKATKATKDADRQMFKGKPGFNANGFPLKKMGGSTKKK